MLAGREIDYVVEAKDGRDKEEGTRHKVSFAQAETGNPSTSFVSHPIYYGDRSIKNSWDQQSIM